MSSRLRALVAEDEPLARELVVELLQADPEIEVIAAVGDGRSALEVLRGEGAEIAFLDIEMPELGGLEVAAALGERELPVCVFVTAYSQHALRAFEVRAFDYVMKPFSDRRFAAALERAKQRARERRLSGLTAQIRDLAAELDPAVVALPAGAASASSPRWLERLSVRCGARLLILDVDEIRWIESEDYYVRLHSDRGRFLLRLPLAELAAQLDPARFVRVHRGALVRASAVRELRRRGQGEIVVLDDGVEVPISRGRRRDARRRLTMG